MPIAIPLASSADAALSRLARLTSCAALFEISGQTLLGERARLGGFKIPGLVSAGGGCRLLATQDGYIALTLARPTDHELLPALLERVGAECMGVDQLAGLISQHPAAELVKRGRLLGLAIASGPRALPQSCCPWIPASPRTRRRRVGDGRPRVLDLSALWAGPLAAHLLWLGGAEVVKLESLQRPDGARSGNAAFYSLLNQGKSCVALDFARSDIREQLLALIGSADIVIEASRPRALRQLGIDADALCASRPGLVWMTITAYGALGEAAEWIGFGDDCGVAGGLAEALHRASGRAGFVGDAIADPLTGIHAALAIWEYWNEGIGGRLSLALTDVVEWCLARERSSDADALDECLRQWALNEGAPFPDVPLRSTVAPVSAIGADSERIL